MFTCRGCGSETPGRSTRRYCSLRCQRDAERGHRVTRWLATGTAFVDSGHDHYVRRHVRDEQGGRCAICEIPASWNDLPLHFVLDHVDGDATNNRRDNLRLVCPNCDSQLSTYKSRNRGRGRPARRLQS